MICSTNGDQDRNLTLFLIGTGGVSITGLVLAKAAGATTIITSSSDEKLRYIKEKYQVDHVINYKKTPDWASEVQKITDGQGVDYILENGGSGTIKQSLSAIAYGGIISVIGFLSAAPQEEMPDVAALALGKGANVRGIMIGSKQMLEDTVRFILRICNCLWRRLSVSAVMGWLTLLIT